MVNVEKIHDMAQSWANIYPITSINPSYLDVEKKRFQGQHILITELYMKNGYWQKVFFKNCKSLLDKFNKILIAIKYPLNIFGMPVDDAHWEYGSYMMLDFLSVKNNPIDYWKLPIETIMDGYGDCEDTSIMTHSMLISENIWSLHCFGYVFKENRLLGGHSFVIANINNKLRLLETTLEQAVPSFDVFPTWDPSSPTLNFGNYTYYIVFAIENTDYLWINKKIATGSEIYLYDNVADLHEKTILKYGKIRYRDLKAIHEIILSRV